MLTTSSQGLTRIHQRLFKSLELNHVYEHIDLLAMRFNANFQKSDDSRIIVQEFLKNSHQNCGQKSRLRPLLPLIFSTFHFLYTNFQTARRGMYLLLDTVYVIQKAEWYNLVYRLDGQLWYHNSRTIMKTIGGPS